MFLLTGTALTSCSKGIPKEGEPTQLTVSISGATTKASVVSVSASDDAEKAVNDLQVFVFDLGGAIDGYGHKVGNAPITVNTHTGIHEVWAVTNFRDLSGVISKTAFMATVAELGEEIVGDMVLVGGKEVNISVNETVCIPVRHLEERAVIRKITNRLSPVALSSQEFRVLDIYLSNVAGDITFDGLHRAVSPVWYNKMGYSAADVASLGTLVHDAVPAAEQVVALNASYEKEHRLYMLPNLIDTDDTSDTWGPRCTRLVVKASIGGDVFYYPLTLPSGSPNDSFEVDELVIARQGSVREETLLPFTAIIYDVSIGDFSAERRECAFTNKTVSRVVFSDPGVDPFTLVGEDAALKAGRSAVLFSGGGLSAWTPFGIELEACAEGAAAGLLFISDASSFDAVVSALNVTGVSANIVVFVSSAEEFDAVSQAAGLLSSSSTVLVILGSVSSMEGYNLNLPVSTLSA